MSLESGTFVQDLQQTNPPGTDKKKQGDDHLRLIKTTLKNTFPNGTRAQYFARGRSVTVTGNINATDMSSFISADATGGAINLSLPTLTSGDDGWFVEVVKTDASANLVTMTGTINGLTNFSIFRRWDHGLFIWTGTQWVAVLDRFSIGPNDLEANAVTNVAMADNAINTAEIVALAVTSAKLADNSVTTAKVVDANVTNPKLVGPRMTMQVLTAGTSYTTPANAHTILAWAVGGGGGGGSASGGSGGTGGVTTFNSVNANGGIGGGISSAGGSAGGTGGTGSATLRLPGSGSDPETQRNSINDAFSGHGAPGIFGTGAGQSVFNAVGINGGTNTGAGASGGSSTNQAGSGGGGGEQFLLLIQAPAASYTYAIGAGGAAGTGGGNNGGTGGSGLIIVFEFY